MAVINLTIAVATIFLAVYAVLQTSVAKTAADAAQKNAQAVIDSERAWILADIGKLPDFDPKPDEVAVLWIFPTIKNYGRTPARIKRVAGIVKLVPSGQQLPSLPEYILGQGFDMQIDLVLPPNSQIQPRLTISPQELVEVRDGKVSLFVHGFIEYLDGVSTEPRKSAYCFGYVIQSGFSPAETGFYPYLSAPAAYTECT